MAENVPPILLDYLTKRYGELKARLTRKLRNPDLASDALQDTWLRLHDQAGDDAAIRSPTAYLLRMAANAAVDIQRRQSQSLAYDEVSELMDLADPAPGPAQLTESRSDLQAMVKALNRLPERQREVLVLVRWEQMPQKDVAKRLGVSLRTVELDLKRALEYLDSWRADAKK